MRTLNFSKIDLLGPVFNITFRGEPSLKTKVGALLTLTYVCSLIACTGVFFNSYFDTSQPRVVYSIKSLDYTHRLNVAKMGMLPIFSIYDLNEVRWLNSTETLDKFTFLLVATEIMADEEGKIAVKDSIARAVPCSEIAAKATSFNYPRKASNYGEIQSVIHSRGLCFDIEDPDLFSIKGHGMEKGDRQVYIRALPCFERDDCNTDDSIFNNYEINAVFPQFLTDVNNKEIPMRMVYDIEDSVRTFNFDMSSTFTMTANTETVHDEPRVWGDGKLISTQPRIVSTVETNLFRYFYEKEPGNFQPQYRCKIDQISFDGCQGLKKYVFKYAPKEHQNTRKYTNLLDTLSNIGGISSILLYIFIYGNYIQLYFRQDKIIAERVFPMLKLIDPGDGNKRREILQHEAVQLLNSYFDIANIYKELCCLKLISRHFLDSHQQELATLYPLHQLQIQKELDSEEKKGKTANSQHRPKKPRRERNYFDKSQINAYRRLKTRFNFPETPDDGQLEFEQPVESPRNLRMIKREIDEVLLKSIEGLGIKKEYLDKSSSFVEQEKRSPSPAVVKKESKVQIRLIPVDRGISDERIIGLQPPIFDDKGDLDVHFDIHENGQVQSPQKQREADGLQDIHDS